MQVLEQRRHAGEGRHGLTSCQSTVEIRRCDAGVVVPAHDHRVQRGVELLDALDGGLDEFGGGCFATGDQAGLCGGVEPAGGLRDR